MIAVTFTDLRNHAKKYFDAVQKGETLEVYKHGKPVAIVSPARRPSADYWKGIKPLPIKLKGISATRLLLQEREESL